MSDGNDEWNKWLRENRHAFTGRHGNTFNAPPGAMDYKPDDTDGTIYRWSEGASGWIAVPLDKDGNPIFWASGRNPVSKYDNGDPLS